jgi:hypothetical protein
MRCENMVKTVFSKGARVSTVGLGVMLAVILLGLAAATAFPTPAGAFHQGIGGPRTDYFMQEIAVDGCRELASENLDEPCRTLDPSTPPYRVKVSTAWPPLAVSNRCEPGTVRQKLEREVDNGPYTLVWEGPYLPPEEQEKFWVRDALLTSPPEGPDTTYLYRHTATCQNASGHTLRGVATTSPRFSLHVLQDDFAHPFLPLVLRYGGNWVTDHDPRATGGTTHEAKEVGATATLRITALGVAWVTTVDEKPYEIQALVSSRPECDPTTQRPEACPPVKKDPNDPNKLLPNVNTGEHDFGEHRVVKWSKGWSNYQRGFNPEQIGENRLHTVEITSKEDSRVDVDAFVIALRR